MAPKPQHFGKYQLGGKIAQGGMAEIFRARYRVASDITKQVIIKRILPRYAQDERFIQMFAAEARIAMGFAHGNIAQVFDFGEVDGAWFLAMELVDGQSLAKLLKAAKSQDIPSLPPALAAMVIAGALKGLHYAHTRTDDRGQPLNIVHRDVSPQNVLVSYEGQVKLVDFGIAKARDSANKTQAGVIKGKYLYFAPEQILEKPLDARCDVFAAGSMLYQLLTGHHPFKGEVTDVMRAIVRGNLAPPRELNPEIPPELEAVVQKAMATNLEDRYQSAGEFERALSAWLHAAAPDATTEQLAQLVRLLFATELAAEGRPVTPSEDFVEQFNSWKREGVADEQPTSETRGERSERSAAKSKTVRRPLETRSVSTRAQKVHPALWGVVAALGLLAGATAFLLLQPPPTFEMQVSSRPAGAQVRLDGKPVPGVTPLKLSALPVNVPHSVKVVAPGMKPWEAEARGEPGSVTVVHADLEALPRVEPSPEPAPAPAPAPEEPKPKVVTEVSWPPTGPIVVEAKAHTLALKGTNAAKLELDPKQTWKISLEGRVSFGGRVADIWVDDCFYALEGPGVTQETAFGVLSNKKPLTVTGAHTLYAFISDTSLKRHSGAFTLKAQPRSGPAKKMLVDSIVHNVMPGEKVRLTVINLRVFDQYRITLRDGDVPARTRKGKKTRVLFTPEVGTISPRVDAENVKPHRVLEPGKSHPLANAHTGWFWFPDDDPSDNEGTIEVTIERDHEAVDLPSFLPLGKKRP